MRAERNFQVLVSKLKADPNYFLVSLTIRRSSCSFKQRTKFVSAPWRRQMNIKTTHFVCSSKKNDKKCKKKSFCFVKWAKKHNGMFIIMVIFLSKNTKRELSRKAYTRLFLLTRFCRTHIYRRCLVATETSRRETVIIASSSFNYSKVSFAFFFFTRDHVFLLLAIQWRG